MRKRGPKFFSVFKNGTLTRFRAVIGRVPEFIYGNEAPKSRENFNIVKSKAWDQTEQLNTNYSIKTIKRRRRQDNEDVYRAPWETIRRIERAHPELLKNMRLVKSAREAWATYRTPIQSCNEAIAYLRGNLKKRPTPEHVFNVILKLNVRPNEIWPDDLADSLPLINLLMKLRGALVERRVVRFDGNELIYMNMVAKYGPSSADEFARNLEDYVQCILVSLANSNGGVDGLAQRISAAGGLLTYDQDIAIKIIDNGISTTYTWSDIECMLEEIDNHPQHAL